MRNPIATALAISIGLIVLLLGYLLPAAFTGNPALSDLRSAILSWAVVLASVAMLVAIFGLLSAHWQKLRMHRNPDRYSIFTVLAFLITFVAGAAAYTLHAYIPQYQQIFVSAIQVPVEASLMAVLAVTLTLGSFRLFQRRQGILAVAFVVSVLLFLFLNSGMTALFESILPENLTGVLLGVAQILPVAGGRGILLGIALGSIMAGLRIVFGAERPYSG